MQNENIITATKEIIDLLEILIPDHAYEVTKKLLEYIAMAEQEQHSEEAISHIIKLLSQYQPTRNWMHDQLEPDYIQESFRSGEKLLDKTNKNNELDNSETEQLNIYPVWFATNREPINLKDLSQGFSDNRAQKLGAVYYGQCEVLIPKTHKFGQTGRSWWRRWAQLDFGGDDHLKIEKINSCTNADDFWQQLNYELQRNKPDERDAVVFLHGYNNSFKEAALRTAQIGFDLKVSGQTAFFSWPSKGGTLSYSTDESSIIASENAITDFLVDFTQKSGAEKVHLIAHSMGNRGLLQALKNITHKVKEKDTNIKFGQIILAAPDLDVDTFRQAKEAYTSLSRSTTIYTSEKDIPVYLSKRLHEYPRLGIVPPITIETGIDTIKVDNFNLFNLGHGYFAEAEALLSDMFDLIRHGEPPYKRQRPREQSDKGQIYWLIDT